MSERTLYIVRARPFYAPLSETGECNDALPLERCFASEARARTFLHDVFPPLWNPFARDYLLLKVVKCFWWQNTLLELHNGKADERFGDDTVLSVSVPLTKLFASITAAGLTPPPMPVPQQRVIGMSESTDFLREWWERQSPAMTREQRTALWKLLDPHPLEIIAVPFVEQ